MALGSRLLLHLPSDTPLQPHSSSYMPSTRGKGIKRYDSRSRGSSLSIYASVRTSGTPMLRNV